MKKIFLPFLISISGMMFSQIYHFDYYLKYNAKNETKISSHENIVNSEEHFYRLIPYIENKNIKAKIVDFKNNYIHTFTVKNELFPLKAEQFIYNYSQKIPNIKESNRSEFLNDQFNSEIINTTTSVDYFKIDKINKTNQDWNATGEAELEKSDKNLAFVGLGLLFDSNFIEEKLALPNMYILQSGSYHSKKINSNLTLEDSFPLELTLKVDSKNIVIK